MSELLTHFNNDKEGLDNFEKRKNLMDENVTHVLIDRIIIFGCFKPVDY